MPRLSGWKFQRELGKGSFGSVYVAKCLKYDQIFAVKVIYCLPSDLTDARREVILRESENMKLVSHPNIIRVYDAFFHDSDFYLVMEFCPNGTLLSRLCETGKLKLFEIVSYFRQILSAIAHCHSVNIAHRDLKPENIFFDEYGRPKIGDWGQSRHFESVLRTHVGTLTYAAPEVVNRTEYDGRSVDMWSLGVMLFAAATGRIPWLGTTPSAREKEIKAGKYVIPEYVDPDVADLIKHLIVVDPSQRLTAAQALEHKLFRSLGERPPLPPLRIKIGTPLNRHQCRSMGVFASTVPHRRRLLRTVIAPGATPAKHVRTDDETVLIRPEDDLYGVKNHWV